MKTLATLFEEIDNSEALRQEYDAISNRDELAAFLKKYGCSADVAEFEEAVKADGEISDQTAANTVGGAGIWGCPIRRIPPKAYHYL